MLLYEKQILHSNWWQCRAFLRTTAMLVLLIACN